MNIETWKDELRVYDKDSCMQHDDEPLMHLWFTSKDEIAFTIHGSYVLSTEGHEDLKYYTLKKVKSEKRCRVKRLTNSNDFNDTSFPYRNLAKEMEL